jgi:hypothetical protein
MKRTLKTFMLPTFGPNDESNAIPWKNLATIQGSIEKPKVDSSRRILESWWLTIAAKPSKLFRMSVGWE